MKIDAVRVHSQAFDRRDPAWQTASYKASQVTGVHVEIEAGGATAVGATAAHPRRLPADVLIGQLTTQIVPALEGHEVETVNARLAKVRAAVHPRAFLAADLALHDLYGKLAGLPSEILWGGPAREQIRLIRMVGLKPVDAVVDAIAPIYDSGVRGFKIKVGEDVDSDTERIRRVRDAYGSDVTISVDANGAYDLDDAIALCEQLADLDVHSIEQPVAYDNVDAMAKLTAVSRVPVMADQMVRTASDIVAVAERGAAHMVSLKLTKMGSVGECLRAIDVCAANGLGVHLGGSASPGVVDSALTRIAQSRLQVEPHAEAGESMALVDDAVPGFELNGPWIRSDGRPGLGGQPSAGGRN